MIPVQTNTSNDLLLPPGKCSAVSSLPICREPHAVTSTWQLTKEDVAALNKNGGLVSVSVVGVTHPPIMLHVEEDLRKVTPKKKEGES